MLALTLSAHCASETSDHIIEDMRSVRVYRPIIDMRSVRVYRPIIHMRSVRAFRRTDMHMHGDKTIGRRTRTFTFDGNRCENDLSLVQLPHSKTGGNVF